MNQNFKLNDIIHHKQLGLMILTEEYPKEVNTDSIGYKLHGTPLFKMIRLVSDGTNQWILYESSSHKVRLATDDDIIEELISMLCTVSLDGEIYLTFRPDDKDIYISGPGDDYIFLDKSTIKLLKKYLKELNV